MIVIQQKLYGSPRHPKKNPVRIHRASFQGPQGPQLSVWCWHVAPGPPDLARALSQVGETAPKKPWFHRGFTPLYHLWIYLGPFFGVFHRDGRWENGGGFLTSSEESMEIYIYIYLPLISTNTDYIIEL